ncbi:hypothetical protein MTO96_016167 [Rhipicephalus appendiculatus]
MSPPRPRGGDEVCDLPRSDITFKTLQRKDSVLFDKLVRHGSLEDFVLPDSDDDMTLPKRRERWRSNRPDIAAASGNEEALRRFLGRGGDPRRRDPAGNDVFDILVANEHWDCLWRVRGLLGLPVEDGGDPEAAASRLNGALPHPAEDLSDASVVSGVNLDVSAFLSTPSDLSTETESLLDTAYVFPHPYLSPVYVDDERARLRKRQRRTAADVRDAAHTDKSAWPATSESPSFDGDSYDDGDVANPTGDSSGASSNLSLELLRLSDEELREQLTACCGHDVGPVFDSKRNVHRHALAHYRLGTRARVRLASPDASFGSASNGNNMPGIARTCLLRGRPQGPRHRVRSQGGALPLVLGGRLERHLGSEQQRARERLRSRTSRSGVPHERTIAKLTSLGDMPGPVTDGTRAVYLNRLARLTSGLVTLHRSRDVVFPDIHTLVLNAANLDAYA